MKRLQQFTLGFVSLCLSASPFTFAQAQSQDRSKAEAIRLTSYEVVQLELKKPMRMRDAEGKEQSYDRAYLVTLKGNFPLFQGHGLELFIGDYRVPEYGSTRDGLYFRIYDQKLLVSLEGKEFRYRFGTAEVHSFEKRFSTKSSQPLKIQKEE
jgi:hypothetical protein